jgi:5-(carboxyamino)imidazole ribonucleotide mutase
VTQKSAKKPQVAIIMGSDSDLPIMSKAQKTLKEFSISCVVKVVSAHRTPEEMFHFAKTAQEQGFKVIIAGAGGAAHLPGMVASLTTLPVIGVPITIGKLNGLDALLSIAQMPKGVPVATMAVDNGANAGLLAARILALQDSTLAKKLEQHRAKQKLKVKNMNLNLK